MPQAKRFERSATRLILLAFPIRHNESGQKSTL